jgi:acyl carrier protein
MDVKDRVRGFIVGELMHEDTQTAVGDDDSLLERGILDSLGLVRLLTFLEKEYRIVVPDEEVIPDHFETINAIVALVKQRTAV